MVPDSALAACQILLHNTKKEQIFSLPMSPLYVLPLFGRVRGCVASFGKGQSPLPLPADTGRIWAAVPPFRRNAYSGHVPPPNRFARDEKKSGRNHTSPPRSADRNRQWWGDDFTHPWVGQAERLACRERLPNAFLRAEARAHFLPPGSNASSPHHKTCAAGNKIRVVPKHRN